VPAATWTPVNVAPDVADAAASTAVDTPVVVTPVATDADGDALQLSVLTQPEHGTVTGPDGAGRVTYAPEAGFAGTDTFAVAADDGADTRGARVTVVVGSAVPRPGDDSVEVSRGAAQLHLATLLANDTDPEGSALTVVEVVDADGPVSLVDLAGDVVQVTTSGTAPVGRFRYVVRDATGMTATGTVHVSVSDAAPGPVVSRPAGAATGTEGDVLRASGAFAGSGLTISGSGPGALVDNGDGTWTWQLATRNQLDATVTVTATDEAGRTAVDVLQVTAANAVPVVTGLQVTPAGCGSTVRLVAGIVDAGVDDAVSVDINWGDGATVAGDRAQRRPDARLRQRRPAHAEGDGLRRGQRHRLGLSVGAGRLRRRGRRPPGAAGPQEQGGVQAGQHAAGQAQRHGLRRRPGHGSRPHGVGGAAHAVR
jgi:hypothetical protein